MSENRRLVVIYGKNRGKFFELTEGENLIGRADPESDEPLTIDLDDEDSDAKVSRQHAILLVHGDTCTIEDLGSLNGTFVKRGDLKRLEEGEKAALTPGDEIVIGKVSLRFE